MICYMFHLEDNIAIAEFVQIPESDEYGNSTGGMLNHWELTCVDKHTKQFWTGRPNETQMMAIICLIADGDNHSSVLPIPALYDIANEVLKDCPPACRPIP